MCKGSGEVPAAGPTCSLQEVSMERVSHGGVHPHIHRRASDHWSQIRGTKDRTVWIVLAATVVASAILGGLYLLLT